MEQTTRLFSRCMGRWLMALLLVMLSSLATKAAEAYACYTSSNTTLTFYYDNLRSSRTGTTYDLNTGTNYPDWVNDHDLASVTNAVFDPSFSSVRPTTTRGWFYYLTTLQSITGMEYLNTSQVTDMSRMFYTCWSLTSLDLSHFNTANVSNMEQMFCQCFGLESLDLSSFNTANVTNMGFMFNYCDKLKTIYVSRRWTTDAVNYSPGMFGVCNSLVGGKGTTYDASHVDKTYACIDLGPSRPGYLTYSEPAELYAEYTPSNTTLTLYYDNLRTFRTGATYTLSTWGYWVSETITDVILDPSMVDARPTSTQSWFAELYDITTIQGLNYLNTSQVTDMSAMFAECESLTSLDVSNFNTANVTNMRGMFGACESLTSLDVSNFNTANVANMTMMFDGCSGLTSLDVSHFNTAKVTEMTYLFERCTGLTTLDLSNWNTANVYDMWGMFMSCTGLTSLDLSSFNTANVTYMREMFNNCSNLRTIYVGSGWSTAQVDDAAGMFYGCTSLVGGKGTTYDYDHTEEDYAHIDGGPSNPGYLTDINAPTEPEPYACYTPSNTTLAFYYDTQRSTRPGTTYNLNTGSSEPDWYTDGTYRNVTSVVFDPLFADARPVTTDTWFMCMQEVTSITGLNYLNTSNVTNMRYLFSGCSALTSLDLSNFNTAQVTDMTGMFSSSYRLTELDLSSFNTSNVISMAEMFSSCQALESLDLSSFNTSQVTDMGSMFNNSIHLQTIYVGSGWSTAATVYSDNMFTDCTRLVGGQGTTYDANHVDAAYAHIDGGPSDPGYFTAEGAQPWHEPEPEPYACYTPSNTTLTFYYDTERSSREGTTYDLNDASSEPGWYSDGTNSNVTTVVFDPTFADARPTTTSNWFYFMTNLQSVTGITYLNTSEVTSMGWMFGYCYNLTSLDLSSFNTSNVENMGGMFFYCSGLTNLDVSNFNTSKVSLMTNMFFTCSGLTSLDLSSFNTAQVSIMSGMFAGCENLTTIYVGNEWSTAILSMSSNMFLNCSSLVGGMGTTYDENHVDAAYAHIDGGPGNPGYLSEKASFKRGDVNGDNNVSITDVTALINYLLSGDATGVNLQAANCNQDSGISITDVTALVNFLLSGSW